MPRMFGLLTVREEYLAPYGNHETRRMHADVECVCGRRKHVLMTNLVQGRIKSCGKCQDRPVKHGDQRRGKTAPLYSVWQNMLRRCDNPNTKGYKHYGGRGIKVCDRWRDYVNFKADMGERPADMSMDRIDVNGDYTPQNCRWLPINEQNRNRRSNRPVEVNGRMFNTTVEMIENYGLSKAATQMRLYRGWSIQDAVNLPPHAKRKHAGVA